jgi:hypothetical protein
VTSSAALVAVDGPHPSCRRGNPAASLRGTPEWDDNRAMSEPWTKYAGYTFGDYGRALGLDDAEILGALPIAQRTMSGVLDRVIHETHGRVGAMTEHVLTSIDAAAERKRR